MEVRIVGQLFQHEVRNIGARDFQFCRLVSVGKAVPVLAGAFTVGEGSRTDDRPVQMALPDVILLACMVGVRWTQEESKHDVFPEDVQISPTVSDPKRRLADKTPDAGLFHRVDDIPCSL